MKNQLAKPNHSALATMAGRLQISEARLTSTLKETVFKGATDSEFATLVIISNELNLNPLRKELHAFRSNGAIVPIVGIDGWLKLINDHPQFDGLAVDIEMDDNGTPISATCRIHRKDRNHPVEITEYFLECYRKTDPWEKMPRRMLRHKAIKECGRVAFGFSGIHDEDDARDIGQTVIIEDEPEPTKALPEPVKAKVRNEPKPETTEELI